MYISHDTSFLVLFLAAMLKFKYQNPLIMYVALCCACLELKYYFKAEVEFERQVTDTDQLQRTTAQFYVPPMISASDPLDIHSVISFFQNSIEAFTSRGSG